MCCALITEERDETDLGSGEDVLDGLGNLGTDAVTLDQGDEVVALRAM